jgi:5'-nucleotidase
MAGRDCELTAFGSSKPLIVLTNDDGVHSPGLVALKSALDAVGEVRVVAPDQNRSGAARSITMHSHLWVEEVELPDGSVAYSTDGTPVDCVRMAALGLLDRTPDLIVSGINLGENLGDDITYSGTVAAALEGIMLEIPAIAVSAEGYHPGYDLSVPARVARLLVVAALERGFPAKTLLNVNCPDRSWEALQGLRLTTLGKRIYGDKVEYRETKGNRRCYHIYNDDLSYQREPGSDFEAVAEGFVAVTPLHFDLMSHEALDALSDWQAALDAWRQA